MLVGEGPLHLKYAQQPVSIVSPEKKSPKGDENIGICVCVCWGGGGGGGFI